MISIRAAKIEDAEGIAKVHVDVWRTTYKGIMSDKVLDGLSYEQRSRVRREHLEKNDPQFCNFVAEDSEKGIIGFAIGGPVREGNPSYDGELYAIYLFREFHGQGIGKKLFLAVSEWLFERGHKSMLIWVLKDNPTRKFYESMGGIELNSKVIEIGSPLDEISYGWTDLSSLVISQRANIKIPRLESDRLILREWRESDIEPFANMNTDPVVMEFFPKLLSYEESKQFVLNSNTILNDKQFGLWAAEVKETKEFIGFIGLAVPTFEAPFTPCTEIGWRLKANSWGNGFATEGAKRVLEYAFSDLDLKEIVSFTSELNVRSWKVMERIGMSRNPNEDFDHPKVEEGHKLRRHVLYRIDSVNF